MPSIFCLTTRQKLEAEEGELLFDILLREGIPVSAPCGGQGTCGKCYVKVLNCDCPPTSLDKEWFDPTQLNNGIRLSCKLQIQDGLTFELQDNLHHDLMMVPLDAWEGPSFSINQNLNADKNIGLAVDIGTQNIKMSFLDLNTGKENHRIYVRNRQMVLGNDIVSRMNFVLTEKKNGRLMQKIIVDTIEEAISFAEIEPNKIGMIVVAGNSVMAHLFLAAPVETLARQPFQPSFKEEQISQPSDLSFNLPLDCPIISVPLIGSFVGGDITADLVYTDILRRKGNFILIDLGTNGEVVVKKGDKAYTTSTAAGPAFEGATIKHGMLALPGAINSFKIINDKIIYETVANEPVKGICGSGLLDIISELVRVGIIDGNGRMIKPDEAPAPFRSNMSTGEFRIGGQVSLTQQDIREVQLAKGAIYAGLKRILEVTESKLDDYDELLLLGNFGKSINVKNAIKISLLPDIDESKIKVLGDVAVQGVRMILLSEESRKETSRISTAVESINISDSATFQDLFVDGMLF